MVQKIKTQIPLFVLIFFWDIAAMSKGIQLVKIFPTFQALISLLMLGYSSLYRYFAA